VLFRSLIHDIVVQDLDILLAIDRAGIVGADGETHQGIYDISFLRILPKIVLMTPSDELEMWKMLSTGQKHKGLAAVRYPRGYSQGEDISLDHTTIEIGKSRIIEKGSKIAYLVFGTLLNTVKKVAKKNGATVVDMRFVKPIDENMIIDICNTHDYIFTVEDNVILGGAGTAVNEVMSRHSLKNNLINIGVPDKIIPHGNQSEILSELGLDELGIEKITNNHMHNMVKMSSKK
jgi:1-deoxy-D-xylulose-5-phosphate synthase